MLRNLYLCMANTVSLIGQYMKTTVVDPRLTVDPILFRIDARFHRTLNRFRYNEFIAQFTNMRLSAVISFGFHRVQSVKIFIIFRRLNLCATYNYRKPQFMISIFGRLIETIAVNILTRKLSLCKRLRELYKSISSTNSSWPITIFLLFLLRIMDENMTTTFLLLVCHF